MPTSASHRIDATRRRRTVAGAGPLRVLAIVVCAVVGARLLDSAAAFWLSIPGALLAATTVRTTRASALAAASVVVAVEATLLSARVSPLPPALLVPTVPAASVAVLLAMRRRFEREREQLRGVALSDPLTGVANRRLLLARADYEIARHRRDGGTFALVMLDLDGFKRLNDRFGHAAGDEILRNVADAMIDGLRGQDTIARLGGDEFCVLAPDTDPGGVHRLANRIGTAVDGATSVVDQLGASIGIAIFPDDGETTADLMAAADERLLEAKRVLYGRGRRRRAA